jgi:hypothetical protein
MKRPGLRWILILLVFVVLGVWLVYVPRRPDRLFDAVPANAIFASLHDRPAQRWDRISAFPPLRPWLAAQGLLVREGTNPTWTTPPEVVRWMKRLASDRVLFAYTPRWGIDDRPAWIGVAWTGGRTRYLQWMVRLGLLKGVREDRQDMVHRFWIVDLAGAAPGRYLSFGFQEGMTVACLSPDPDAVRSLLILMDRRRPGSQAALFPIPGALPGDTGRSADQAWILKPGVSAMAADRYCSVRIDRLDAGGLVGTVGLPSIPRPSPEWGAESEQEVRDFFADSPSVWFKMPHSFWPVLARTFVLAGPVRLAGEALLPPPTVSSRPVYGGILNTNYEIRLKGPFRNTPFLAGSGLKLPTAVLAAPMPDGEGVALGQIMGLLDRLNARQGWGLIPHPVSVQGRTLTLIEESRPNLYGQFELDERVALTPLNQTMLVSSHAGSLKRLLNRTPATHEICLWKILTGDEVVGGIWMQGSTAWPIIRTILGATMLIQSVSGASSGAESRREIADWIRWWDGCRTLDQASVVVRADSAGGPARADFEFLFSPLD